MEKGLEDMTKLIYQKPYKFKVDNDKWANRNRLGSLKEQKIILDNPNILTDSLTIVELFENAKIQDLKNWNKDELKNVYLISNNQNLSFRKVQRELELSEKEQIKKLKKQIRQFNNNKSKWRSFPISISRPIYTNDKKYALIAYNLGNNGGKIVIYKLDGENWIFAGEPKRWAY
ncbi:hypothetical protein D7036_17375 [Aquimarina sp. BL5]|uniref:hypothetical protein n=1 Tax=Aquimarina sp. BL5 TaxID=1714860 RepID=UPI000EA8590D|nr:hypothetical protein [Aquimarina sp. BL5]RKN01786.1 hypothetical protein D7036_17375 [Aquimarina sp. BL5]